MGIFWVVVPQVIMDDAGPATFGLNWGLSQLGGALGIVFFGNFFDIVYSIFNDGGIVGQCKKGVY